MILRQEKHVSFPSTTIVMPAYNEETRIGNVLKEISTLISSNSLNWEVIVSIDGVDQTEEIVKEYISIFPFIKYWKEIGRSGKGNAIKRVINNAEGEYTLIMDADGAVKLKDIMSYFSYLHEYDVIAFDRYSNHDNFIPILRRLPSRAFNLLIRALLKVNIKDTQCGYKLMKTKYAKEALSKTTVTNTFFDVALLYYLKKLGARITEVDIKYEHSSESKFNVVLLTAGEAISLASFIIRHSRFYKYVPEWLKELYVKRFRWI